MVKQKSRRARPLATKCFFCEKQLAPDYKETNTLQRFISERGKILPRSKTGVCAKHHRRLAQEIKRARFLSLLPFIVQV